MSNKIKCPACNGKKYLIVPERTKRDIGGALSFAAKRLKRAGFTIREIAKMLGYSHPGSVSHLLNKKPNSK